MATYNLNAADLITLLNSTVVPSTEGHILEALINSGEFPQGAVAVETDIGPSGGVPTSAQNIAIAPGTQFELITLPTSTWVPSATYPAPTVGPAGATSVFSFTSPGGVIIGAGDQAVTVLDSNTSGTGDTLLGGAGYEKLVSSSGANVLM